MYTNTQVGLGEERTRKHADDRQRKNQGAVCHHLAPLTTRSWVPDGDGGLAETLGLASRAVVGVGAAVLAAHGLVGAVALDGIAGAAGGQLLDQAHGVEETLLLTLLCGEETQKTCSGHGI